MILGVLGECSGGRIGDHRATETRRTIPPTPKDSKFWVVASAEASHGVCGGEVRVEVRDRAGEEHRQSGRTCDEHETKNEALDACTAHPRPRHGYS